MRETNIEILTFPRANVHFKYCVIKYETKKILLGQFASEGKRFFLCKNVILRKKNVPPDLTISHAWNFRRSPSDDADPVPKSVQTLLDAVRGFKIFCQEFNLKILCAIWLLNGIHKILAHFVKTKQKKII